VTEGGGTNRWGSPLSESSPGAGPAAADGAPNEARLELIGSHFRASGNVDTGRFHRVSDYVNLLDGFCVLRDAVLLTRTGAPTRLKLPELRVRLGDIAIVGQRAIETRQQPSDAGVFIVKQPHRLVIVTQAQIISGFAYVHEHASLMAFIDSSDPRWIPMTNVRVRWLSDQQPAARYPFAVVQRSQMLGISTENEGSRTAQGGNAAADANLETPPAIGESVSEDAGAAV
jgi:hypothetical protein